MGLVQNILKVSEKIEFYKFVKDVHNYANCSDKKCLYEIDIDSLEDLCHEQYSYEARVNWFIRESFKNANAFDSMFFSEKKGKRKSYGLYL